MADNTQITGTTGAELAASPDQTSAQQGEAQETPVSPSYVTKEELDQILAENFRRTKQSERDRMKQIDDKLSAIKTRLEAGGTQLTPQQVNALREQIEEEGGSEGQAAAQASATTPEMQAQAEFVYAQLEATFADVGTKVTPNDPEYREIQAVLDDPKGSLPKLIRVAARQAEAKAERITSLKQGAAARAVSAGGMQSTSTRTLTAEEKISKGLSGNWAENRG
ncbi:MAG: hypothetical protein HY864_00795 [Chloroflexi bacterium]|nr:hypothetical protein [Chloroflexota bacterium]